MQKPLQDGLILRSLSENHASDWERLADFYTSVNTADDPENVKQSIRHWVQDLMQGHPTVTPEDIFIVVDPAKDDQLVSATLLIPQHWRYEEVVIPVGRPELVGTHPEYRSRGLVRALFEAVHQRSAALGHELQVITGIPYFYRQFGYTMAVELGQHAVFPLSALPPLAADYQPAFTLRPATIADAPAIAAWSQRFARQRLLTDVYSPEALAYEITGRQPDSFLHVNYQVIVNPEGQGVGYLTFLDFPDEPNEIRCTGYVLGDQASYLETFNDVVQGVKAWVTAHYGYTPAMLAFGSGIHETLDRLIDRSPGGMIRRREYAWYLRVPDAIRFLKKLRPVLERRLEDSGAHRYTGELKIGFYDLTGISLKFERGCLVDIVPLKGKDGYDVSYPWHLFWNVVFGYRTPDEIYALLPDTWANSKGIVLLETLFPKIKSWVRGLA